MTNENTSPTNPDDIDWSDAFETYHPALLAGPMKDDDWRVRIRLDDFGIMPTRTILIGFGALIAAVLSVKP